MGFPKVTFKVVENRKCPLFVYGDTFCITGIAIAMNSEEDNSFITTSVVHTPQDKKCCKILNADLTRLVIQYERGDKIPVCMINCSGCTGSIRLVHNKEDVLLSEETGSILSDELASMMHLLSGFAFFKSIDQKNLNKVVQFFRLNIGDDQFHGLARFLSCDLLYVVFDEDARISGQCLPERGGARSRRERTHPGAPIHPAPLAG